MILEWQMRIQLRFLICRLQEGMEFVNQLDGVGAMWILEDGSLQYSDGFEEYTE